MEDVGMTIIIPNYVKNDRFFVTNS